MFVWVYVCMCGYVCLCGYVCVSVCMFVCGYYMYMCTHGSQYSIPCIVVLMGANILGDLFGVYN